MSLLVVGSIAYDSIHTPTGVDPLVGVLRKQLAVAVVERPRFVEMRLRQSCIAGMKPDETLGPESVVVVRGELDGMVRELPGLLQALRDRQARF